MKNILVVTGFISGALVAACAPDTSYLPKQSSDANQILLLQSNVNCQFFVDGQPLARGKRVRVVVTKNAHQLVCKPDEYRAKEEYVQPPYDPDQPIGFTFLLEDQLHNIEKPSTAEGKPFSEQRSGPMQAK